MSLVYNRGLSCTRKVMIKTQKAQLIKLQDFDDLVIKTYGKPYSFQQQNGCQERGTFHFTVPDNADDFEAEEIAEEINGSEMGVSFAAWLARDPKAWSGKKQDEVYIDMFWNRNFYPDIQTVANDLHSKGLFPKGEYVIEIDW